VEEMIPPEATVSRIISGDRGGSMYRTPTTRIFIPDLGGEVEAEFSSRALHELNDRFDIDTILRFVHRHSDRRIDGKGKECITGVKRVDLALDEHEGLLDVRRVRREIYRGRLQTKIKLCHLYGGYDLVRRRANSFTVYLGSRRGMLFIRFYDRVAKIRESGEKSEFDIWNRLELEMKGRLGNAFVQAYCERSLGDIRGFVRSKLDFKCRTLERDRHGHNNRVAPAQWWDEFLGGATAQPIRLPVWPYGLDDLERFVERTSISALDAYMEIRGAAALDAARYARRTEEQQNPRHQKLRTEWRRRRGGEVRDVSIAEYENNRGFSKEVSKWLHSNEQDL
jgi:hypothetical protein